MERRERDSTVVDMLLRKLKSNLRITSDDLDEELENKLLSAVQYAENQVKMVIIPSHFRITIDEAVVSSVALRSPIISIDSVTANGQSVAFTRSGSKLMLMDAVGTSVTVEYKAGMTEIPEDIIYAICIKASSMFDSPTDTVEALINSSQNLLRPYRTYGD